MTLPNDAATREPPREERPISLPKLKTATARHVQQEKPRRFVTQGTEYFETDVIEIDVETDGDFAIAGTGPALFVGEVPVVDSEKLGPHRYRIFAPGSTTLPKDALLALGRAGSGTPRPEQKTKLRLQWNTAAGS